MLTIKEGMKKEWMEEIVEASRRLIEQRGCELYREDVPYRASPGLLYQSHGYLVITEGAGPLVHEAVVHLSGRRIIVG